MVQFAIRSLGEAGLREFEEAFPVENWHSVFGQNSKTAPLEAGWTLRVAGRAQGLTLRTLENVSVILVYGLFSLSQEESNRNMITEVRG